MEIEQRILVCKLIEKMEQDPDFGKQLGLKDTSKYLREFKGNDEQNRQRRREERWQEKREVTAQ